LSVIANNITDNYSFVVCEQNFTVEDTLQTGYPSGTLQVNGTITNNGLIKHSLSLTINSAGDIINNGTWENHKTYLNGTTDQNITLINDMPVSGDVIFDANYGSSPYQWYYNDVFLDSPDFNGETSDDLTWLVPVSDTWYGTFYCQTGSGNSRNIIVEGIEEASHALLFDGTDDFVKSGGVPFPSGDHTIEAWIHPTVFSGIQEIVFFYNDTTSAQFRIEDNGSLLYGESVSGDWDYVISPANSFMTNTWTHVAVTKQSDHCNLYINGLHAGYNQFDKNPTPDTLTIGGRVKYMDRFFEGNIDEVRIWTHARSQSEIQANLSNYLDGTETWLYVYYRMNKGLGQTTYGLSGNGFDGQLGSTPDADINDPTWIPTDWPYVVVLPLDLKNYLQGSFNGTDMNADLNPADIPLSQPYNTSPWNYTGTESVASIPNANVVDWILIELRDTTEAQFATGTTMIARQAGFLLKNGTICSLDGSSNLFFNVTIADSLFAVVWHRNHLAVMSAFSLIESAGIYTYDFTSGSGQVYGGVLGHKEIAPGIWGMIAGDGNANGQVNNVDKNDIWAQQAGTSGYLSGDFSMDSQVNNLDKNDLWAPNTGSGSQVPD